MNFDRPGKTFLVVNLALAAGCVGIVFLLYYISGHTRDNAIHRLFGDSLVDVHPVSSGDVVSVSAPYSESGMPMKSAASFRLAVAPITSPESSLILYHELAEYIGGELGMGNQILLRSTYAEINEALKNRRCDAAFVCTYSFLKGEKEFGMTPLAVPVFGGRRTYHSFFIVPAASPAETILDLKGKKFASADILSFTGWIYPALWLKKRGRDPFHYFKEHIIAGSHDRAVLSVSNGYADGAAVDNIVYEQMPAPVRANTRVIEKSPPFGMPPFCVHPSIDSKFKKDILSVMLRMHETSEGLRVLASLKIERFEVPDAGFYRTLREAVGEWESE